MSIEGTTEVVLTAELQKLRDTAAEMLEKSEALTSLTLGQLNWSPGKGVWSIGQVVDHLNKSNGPTNPNLAEAVRTATVRSDGPFRYKLLERLFIRMLSPNPPFKVPVPPPFIPDSAAITSDAVTRFQEIQTELTHVIESANGLDLTKPRIASAANSRIKMCLGAWFHATLAHEQYHWLQIEAVRANPAFPKE